MEFLSDKETDLLTFQEKIHGCKVTLYQDRHSGEILANMEEISLIMGLAPGDPRTIKKLMKIIKRKNIIHNLKSMKNENRNFEHK